MTTQELKQQTRAFVLLRELAGDLTNLPESRKAKSGGYMPLCFDRLHEEAGRVEISLAHYFEQCGDLVPDPDMQILVFTSEGRAQARTFQNAIVYREAYADGPDGEQPTSYAADMQSFLVTWLENLVAQGFSLKHPDNA